MMNFRKARQAFGELRPNVVSRQKDPVMWNVTLGLEAAVTELEQRLSRIEANQEKILRLLSQRQ